MPKHLTKSYFYEPKKNLFYRANVDKEKHLLREADNSVCFNAKALEKYLHSILWIGVKFTDGEKLIISKEDFLKFRTYVNHVEPQWAINPYFMKDVVDKSDKTENKNIDDAVDKVNIQAKLL